MCALGLGPDHPETVACARWLDAAGEGAGVGDQAQNFADAANLPEIAEWFVTTLNCGVLEPPREPPGLPIPEGLGAVLGRRFGLRLRNSSMRRTAPADTTEWPVDGRSRDPGTATTSRP